MEFAKEISVSLVWKQWNRRQKTRHLIFLSPTLSITLPLSETALVEMSAFFLILMESDCFCLLGSQHQNNTFGKQQRYFFTNPDLVLVKMICLMFERFSFPPTTAQEGAPISSCMRQDFKKKESLLLLHFWCFSTMSKVPFCSITIKRGIEVWTTENCETKTLNK